MVDIYIKKLIFFLRDLFHYFLRKINFTMKLLKTLDILLLNGANPKARAETGEDAVDIYEANCKNFDGALESGLYWSLRDVVKY